jgi:hypothetical protein
MSMSLKKALAAAVMAAALAPMAAHAAVVTMTLDTSVNGDMPAGTLTATFADTGAGQVTLTMANNLGAGEFDVFWLFNLNPYPSPLTVTHVSGQQAAAVLVGPTEGSNAMQAGLFDFGFRFPIPNSADRFVTGETSVYLLSAVGLDALDFIDYSTESNSGSFGWLSAARIQGIQPQGSGTIGTKDFDDGSGDDDDNDVPEPASLALVGLGLAAAGLARRRRRTA